MDVSFYSKKSAIGQNLLGEAGSCVKSVPFVGNFLYIELTFTSIFKSKASTAFLPAVIMNAGHFQNMSAFGFYIS